MDPIPCYLRCTTCGWIIDGVPWDQQDHLVRPCCGQQKFGGLLKWPNSAPKRYHELSCRFQISHKDRDSTDIALVMLAIASESALVDLLWDMLGRHEGLPPDEYRQLLFKHGTRSQRLDLLQKRSGCSADAAFQTTTLVPTFMSDWNVVVELRNQIAHARCEEYRKWDDGKNQNLLPAARRFREQFFDGFAVLNNYLYRDKAGR